MAASERRNAAQKTAAHLIAMGYPHGKRRSRPSHNNFPVNLPGSAAYRRLQLARGHATPARLAGGWHPEMGG
jgi:hypothetical protein